MMRGYGQAVQGKQHAWFGQAVKGITICLAVIVGPGKATRKIQWLALIRQTHISAKFSVTHSDSAPQIH
jgi:hypothetical protein